MEYKAPYGSPDPDASYVDRDTPGAVRGSVPPAAAIEDPQRELVNLITSAGLVPSGNDLFQAAIAVQGGALTYAAASASPTALTAALTPPLTAQRVGMRVTIKITSANAAAATLNAGPGPLPIVTMRGGAISLGDLPLGSFQTFVNTGTAWMLAGLAYSEVPRVAPTGVILYVRPDGNDNNDGLTNSASGAFLTIQGAVTSGLSRFSLPPGQAARIQLGVAGTYAGPGSLPYISSPIEIRGDPANQAGYVISGAGPAGGNVGLIGAGAGQVTLNGATISNTGAINHSINADNSGYVLLQNVTFLTSLSTTYGLMAATGNGVIRLGAGCIVNASAGYMWLADGGTIIMGANVALQSTPSFTTATAQALNGGKILRGGTSTAFTGTGAVGLRYNATLNGIINMLFGGANFIPGNSAGTTATGGQYQ
ncbi:hypothetical protein ABLE91_16800 [Aquabacter sp. CN5-332]|uniref:hypothetical protein n=1 Tax=Aquabacter sp. CN5-332 TaxID=3156608 RepID=UPI0032B33BDE